MLLYEFRIILPVTVQEYQVGQLYCVAKSSKEETGKDGDGVEVLKNEPYEKEDGEKGQFTDKKYYLKNKVPGWVAAIAPKSALILGESAWNAYPKCKTELSSPYMGKSFTLRVETIHKADRGDSENVHNLSEEQLKKRKIVYINISDDVEKKDYKEEEDPTKFKSTKTERGPFEKDSDWQKTCEPVMCCYKLVTVEFVWFGLQSKMEKFIINSQTKLFHKFHRQVVCTLDEWVELTMDDIRRIEAETKEALDNERGPTEEEETSDKKKKKKDKK
eukprot:GCRY01002098.1.p1 GENE.GCRY01002098.1~~GCRY01002098.1.p1  ORF type:complete len:274 (-),score=68.27 GCRY01002098.1:149-970(-)